MPAQDTKQPWQSTIQRRMQLLRAYEHDYCETVTNVSDDITRKSVLDPYYYDIETTFCAECQDLAPARECILDDGRTLYVVTSELRKQTPVSFKIVRFVIVPFTAALVGALLGFLLTQYVAIAVAGFLIGLLLGYFLLSRFVAIMLRGRGMLWE